MTYQLDVRQRGTLKAICDTFMPRLHPGAGDDARLFSLGADDVDLARAVEQAFGVLSGRQAWELGLFLRLLDSRAFMLAVTGRARAFPMLDMVERETTLLSLATSAVPQLRTGFQALKRLTTFLFYSAVDPSGNNPALPSLGYHIPRPPPGASPLEILSVQRSTSIDADVCIVGSGAGGGVVAATLAGAGMRVVVIEAGPGDQGADFDQREIIGMQRLYLDQGTTASRDLGVAILAGSCVGGGTAVNWQTSLRLPDFVRDEWQARSGLAALADGRFDAATDRVCARLHVGTSESGRNANNAPLERGCTALGYHWRVIPRNARGCDLDQCGFCVFGCRVGGKQSTATTYLVDAQRAAVAATILVRCAATRVRVEQGRVIGVDAVSRDEQTGATHDVHIRAPLVVTACGALETPALLLRSGVAHPELGRNLFLHPTSGVAGRYADRVDGWIGAPQSVLCDHFERAQGHYGFRFEAAPVHPGLIAMAQPWHGARDHRARMQHAGHASAFIVLTRDQRPGRVRIDGEGRAVVHYAVGPQERRLLQHGIAEAARLHWAAGALEIHTLHARPHVFRRATSGRAGDFGQFAARVRDARVHGNRSMLFSAHQMGTCRMGMQPRASVCDDKGQVRGVPGLFVADASLFPASSGVNPMITIMALAQLVADGIAARGA